jgi:chemotaxis protein CheX
MPKTVDVVLFNAFYAAAEQALQIMGSLRLVRRALFIKPDNGMQGDYYAVIGMSRGMVGNCAVSMPRLLADHVIGRVFGATDLDREQVLDGIGEVVNLIAGGGKRILADTSDYRFSISPPTALANRGADPMLVYNPAGTVCVVIDCRVEPGPDLPMHIELAFELQQR